MAEFIDQSHGSGRVASLISLYRYTVDDDFSEAFLRDNVCSSPKRLGQYSAVFVYTIVGWFASESEDKVVRKAGASPIRKESNMG